MTEIIEGQPIGTYGLIAVKELPPIVHKNYKERRIEVICPLCNKSFQTDLRRLTKKDTDKRRAVRMCPECSAKYIAELNKIRGEQQIDDLSGKKIGKLTVLYPLKERKRRSIIWHCKCDCGGTKDVIQIDLKRGHTIQHFEYRDIGWDTKEDFQERLFRDEIKNQYCRTHNINLIRIPYWDYNKIDKQYIRDILDSIC